MNLMKKLKSMLWYCLIGLVLTVTGCATTKPPIYQSQSFDPGQIELITLLPIIDARIDKSHSINLEKYVLPTAAKNLKRRGYAVQLSELSGLDRSQFDVDALQADPAAIAAFSPSEARWIAVLFLHDAARVIHFGVSANAELSGAIIDKESNSVVWRHKTLSKFGQGGLIGLVAAGVAEESAVQQATIDLFKALPKRLKS